MMIACRICDFVGIVVEVAYGCDKPQLLVPWHYPNQDSEFPCVGSQSPGPDAIEI